MFTLLFYFQNLHLKNFVTKERKTGRGGMAKQKRPKKEWLERQEKQMSTGKAKRMGSGQQCQILGRETFPYWFI